MLEIIYIPSLLSLALMYSLDAFETAWGFVVVGYYMMLPT